MSTPWAKVLTEINEGRQAHGPNTVDVIRRQKIAAVTAITGRPLVIYATACTTPGKPIPDILLMIEPSDKLGFQEVTAKIEDPTLMSSSIAQEALLMPQHPSWNYYGSVLRTSVSLSRFLRRVRPRCLPSQVTKFS